MKIYRPLQMGNYYSGVQRPQVFVTAFMFICCFTFLALRTSQDKSYTTHSRSHVVKVSHAAQNKPPPCGQICEYSGKERKRFNNTINGYIQLTKDVNCNNILGRMAWREDNIAYPPPQRPPPEMMAAFTQNGEVPITKYRYHNDVNLAPRNVIWKERVVREMQAKHKKGESIGFYNRDNKLNSAISMYQHFIAGKDGMVIGTEMPWLEAILLNAGARKITTLEYGTLDIQHPQVTTVHPIKMAQKFLAGEVRKMDFAASFSSIEHSGLGRYGDPINPYGDLEAMAQIWCMLKPGGMLILGVPIATQGNSYIEWNAHRYYAKARLPHLTANWDVLELAQCKDDHGVLVMTKLE